MLEQWNNGLWESGAMRLFANFFLKTKVRNEIIPSKNQYSNIPPFQVFADLLAMRVRKARWAGIP